MKWFRVAKDASTTRHVVVSLLQMLCFWGTFLFVLPAVVLAASNWLGVPALGSPAPRLVGGIAFALASCLGVWSAWTMARLGRGTPLPLAAARQLVLRGPYRWLRNPMALAGIGQGVAVGLWCDAPLVVLYALAGSLLWHFVARPPEERDLAARFGPAFAAYRAAVPLWLPRWLPRAGERWLGVGLVVAAALLLAGLADPLPAWPRATYTALLVLPALVLIDRQRR